MYYIIQENTFREANYNNLINTLDRMELPYEIVKVLPFVEEFEFNTDRKDVFCFGSVKMSRVAKKYNWYPGSLLNDNHNYTVYSEYYKDNLLNYDSTVQRFGDEIKRTDLFFARPVLDNKTFTGRVFDMYEWNEFKERFYSSGHESSLNDDTLIQVSSVKKILKEFRFWVIGGEVVTGSLYKTGTFVHSSDIIDDGALDFCKEMVKLYQLADAFVMDVCEVLNGQLSEYKIVESGCINSAGFYKCNMQKMIDAIERKWGNE
jgi:hypothetical protein